MHTPLQLSSNILEMTWTIFAWTVFWHWYIHVEKKKKMYRIKVYITMYLSCKTGRDALKNKLVKQNTVVSLCSCRLII